MHRELCYCSVRLIDPKSTGYVLNGNLLTGDSFTNTWDYRNRLTQTQLNGTTTSYLYDINDERIAEGANGPTTTYPFTFYNVATSSGGAATFTKHVFANGEPVADVQGSTTTAKVYYSHDDALGGANVLSNASGTLAEVIEDMPRQSSLSMMSVPVRVGS